VTLTVDGKRYQVDLSKANFDEWVAPLVKAVSPSRASRRTTRRPKATKRATVKRTTVYAGLSTKDQSAVRAYLKRPSGRIADEAVKAWKAAGKPKG